MNQQFYILNHLKKHGTITPLEALEYFGCFRLSGRIFDIKEQYRLRKEDNIGQYIETENETTNGKTYARYRLVSEPVEYKTEGKQWVFIGGLT